jgi:hypothetical protein
MQVHRFSIEIADRAPVNLLLSGESWERPRGVCRKFYAFYMVICRYSLSSRHRRASLLIIISANLAGNIDIELVILVDHKGSSNDPDLHIHLT